MGQVQGLLPLDEELRSAAKAAPAAPEDLAQNSGSGLNELSQIQELLFGQQQRSNEQQIETLKQALDSQLSVLKTDIVAMQKSADDKLEHLTTSFTQKLTEQQSEHAKVIAALTSQVETTEQSLNSKLTEQADTAQQSETTLTNKLDEAITRASSELKDTTETLIAKIDLATENLKSNKVDRILLSELMSDMANRLAKDT